MRLDAEFIDLVRSLVMAVAKNNICSASKISKQCDVSENTIRNFALRRETVRNPDIVFIRRLVSFLYTSRDCHIYFNGESASNDNRALYAKLEERVRWDIEWFDKGDYLSRMVGVGKQFVDIVSGDYYAYRLIDDGLFVSHIHVSSYDPYDKVPKFTNSAIVGNAIRTAAGRVYPNRSQIVMNGSIKRGSDIEGSKIIILPYPNNLTVGQTFKGAKGVYLSYNPTLTGYDVGAIIVIRTDDPFDAKHTGFMKPSEKPDVYNELMTDSEAIKARPDMTVILSVLPAGLAGL